MAKCPLDLIGNTQYSTLYLLIIQAMKITILSLSLILFGGFFFVFPASAQSALEEVRSLYFDAATIVKGYTIESTDELFRVGIRPDTLNVSTRVDIKTLQPEMMAPTLPTNKKLLGNIYLFDILNKSSYDGSDYFFLEIKYPEDYTPTYARKRIYFFNKVLNEWIELPSEDSPENGSVRALIHLAYARLAIFEESDIMEVGQASWYAYKDCDCAASPDYPKGTELVVSLLDDPESSVTVVVNDYGPERDIHPDRVIDLDAVAFEKLAPLWMGLVDVHVRPL